MRVEEQWLLIDFRWSRSWSSCLWLPCCSAQTSQYSAGVEEPGMAAGQGYVVTVCPNKEFCNRARRLGVSSNIYRSSNDVRCRCASCTFTPSISNGAEMML
ncbi:hypothetical protein IG631_09550 [Alternaria alternata]|nr:hypothetical protein IG631_09550 [Alternaria alternata]